MLDFQFEEDAGQVAVLERLIRLRFVIQVADTGAETATDHPQSFPGPP
jgi:hypothetical protein